jgi:hypothetical protein
MVALLRLLLEAEMGGDAMTCHDGGFHYAGDFMSMEQNSIIQPSVVSPDDLAELRRRRYVEPSEDGTAYRVTEAGRRVVSLEIEPSPSEQNG